MVKKRLTLWSSAAAGLWARRRLEFKYLPGFECDKALARDPGFIEGDMQGKDRRVDRFIG